MKKIYILFFVISVSIGYSQSSSKTCDTITQCGCPYAWWTINGIKADITFTATGLGRHLYASEFNFSIPSTATVTGIELSFSYTVNAPANTLEDTICSLMKYGFSVGAQKFAQTSPYNNNSSVIFGNSADMWSTTWSPAEINLPNFGFDFRLRAKGITTQFGITNGFMATVYYTDLSGIKESQSSGSALYTAGKMLYLQNLNGANNKVEFYDMLGRKVFESAVDTDQGNVDLNKLNKGVYICKLYTGEKEISRKVYVD